MMQNETVASAAPATAQPVAIFEGYVDGKASYTQLSRVAPGARLYVGPAPAVTDIGLPTLRDLLKAAQLSGQPINLSAAAAGALHLAMSTGSVPPGPASEALQAGRVSLDEAIASGELQQLKAEAHALAADGSNWSMDVGCMFVLAMIERIEAGAVQQLDTMSDCAKCKAIGAAYKIGRDYGRDTAPTAQQPVGYLKHADLVKLGNCRAELWANLDDADAVPVYLGAPSEAADKTRIAKLEAEVADWMKCSRDNQEMLNTIGRQLGGRIPKQLVSEVARQCVDRIGELEAMLAKRRRANFILSQTIHNIMVGNQSAWIEWQQGAGAESAMEWIQNGLIGPGLIPAPGFKSAQEWFNVNSDDRMEPTDPHSPGSALSAAPVAGSAA